MKQNRALKFTKNGAVILYAEWVGGKTSGYLWLGSSRTEYLCTLREGQLKRIASLIPKKTKALRRGLP